MSVRELPNEPLRNAVPPGYVPNAQDIRYPTGYDASTGYNAPPGYNAPAAHSPQDPRFPAGRIAAPNMQQQTNAAAQTMNGPAPEIPVTGSPRIENATTTATPSPQTAGVPWQQIAQQEMPPAQSPSAQPNLADMLRETENMPPSNRNLVSSPPAQPISNNLFQGAMTSTAGLPVSNAAEVNLNADADFFFQELENSAGKPRAKVIIKADAQQPGEPKTPVNVISGTYPRATARSDDNYIANEKEIEAIFREDAAFIPGEDKTSQNKKPERAERNPEAEFEEIRRALGGNYKAMEAAQTHLGIKSREYERTFISYWGEGDVDKYEIAARKIQGRIDSKNSTLTGIVINSAPIEKNPRTGKKDIMMQVLLDDEEMQCIPAWIGADDMTLSYADIPYDRRYGFKESFGRRVIGTRIQFMPKTLVAGNEHTEKAQDKEYSLVGSRVEFLSQMRKRYFDDPDSPDLLNKNSLVEGVVVAVYSNRILFNVAGIELLLWTTIPYITGVSYISDTDIYGGKRLFRKNERKPCVIDSLTRDENGKVKKIHLNFRLPLRKKIHDIVSTLQYGNYLQGTILRFARGPSIDGQEGREFAIIKCSIGIEAACPIPGWDVLPPIGSDVALKVIYVNKNDQVYGHAKRNA